MFVLKYKSNESSPSVKDHSYTRDIVSDDVDILQQEIRHASTNVRDILFPLAEIKQYAHVPDATSSLDMCKHELKHIFRDLSGHSIENPSFSDVMTYTPSSHDDIISISNINSCPQLLALSNIASNFSTVYFVKPKLIHPLNENVYVFLIHDDSTSSSTSSKLIFKLSDIIDFGLCIYSHMSYCVNLGMSISDDNEFHTNFVKLPLISLSPDVEYQFYIEGLFNYALDMFRANDN